MSLANAQGIHRFDFGTDHAAPGFVAVTPSTLYSKERGYGFEPGFPVATFSSHEGDSPTADGVIGEHGFYFTVDLPEGNHRVRVTLGTPELETRTTIKAELRRLMVREVTTRPGQFTAIDFVVNTRTPNIAASEGMAGGVVQLKSPRETTTEAWAWDQSLTIEFGNNRPAVCAIEIEPTEVPTIFLIGDSTVCDQPLEPYTSWGQMFTAFFKPDVAIANHGESGETYRDSIVRRRLDKIISVMQPGDFLIMQFGHNDQKQIARNAGGPFTTYQDELRQHVEVVRAAGGNAIVVTPVERRQFGDDGRIDSTLTDYAEAARQSAMELGVPLIDLNAMSIPFYEALESFGHDNSTRAFAPGDNTHHNNYGAYEIAKMVVNEIIHQEMEIARHVVDDFEAFDPSSPDPVADFKIPASPGAGASRPLGD